MEDCCLPGSLGCLGRIMGARHWSWSTSPAFAVFLANPLGGHLATRWRRDLATGYLCTGPVAFAFVAGPGSGLAVPYSFGGNDVASLSRSPTPGGYHPFPGWESGLRTARSQRFVPNSLCLLSILSSSQGAGNSILAWAHVFAQVHHASQCWVCTELPTSAAEGLPWCITPATASNWTGLCSWWMTRDWTSHWKAVDALL